MYSLELGIMMTQLFTKVDENAKMIDAFIVIVCNLLGCLDSNPTLPKHNALRMVFRATETVSNITEFFRKRKQTLDLLPIKNQLVFLLSKVFLKGLGKHDDFEGFIACGINDDMGDIDTSVRDMVISLWLILSDESKSFLRTITVLPEQSAALRDISLSYVRYIASDLEIITSQITLFA